MSKVLRLAVAVWLGAWLSSAGAAVTYWKLDGVTFSDGGVAKGWFALDDSAPGLLGGYDIETPTVADFPGGSYTLEDLQGPVGDVVRSNAMFFTNTDGFLALTFAGQILNSNNSVRVVALGTTIPIAINNIENYEYLAFSALAIRGIVGGSIVAVVPEPHSAVLLAAGLSCVILLVLQRRRRPVLLGTPH